MEDREIREVLVRRGAQEFGLAIAPAPVAMPLFRRALWIAVCLGALALLALPRLAPVGVAPTVETVPVGSVSYGPDISPGAVVDPSFRPSLSLPTGLALSANFGRTYWGCGDRKVGGAQPPDGLAAIRVERVLGELARYVRNRANLRDSVPFAYPLEPALRVKGPTLNVALSLDWRNGSSGEALAIPLERGSQAEAELDRLVHVVAKRLTDSVGDSIQEMRANDPSLP